MMILSIEEEDDNLGLFSLYLPYVQRILSIYLIKHEEELCIQVSTKLKESRKIQASSWEYRHRCCNATPLFLQIVVARNEKNPFATILVQEIMVVVFHPFFFVPSFFSYVQPSSDPEIIVWLNTTKSSILPTKRQK